MTKYLIELNQFMEREEIEVANLEDAQDYVDDNLCYNQQDAIIYDANGNEVCRRNWVSVSVSNAIYEEYNENREDKPEWDELDEDEKSMLIDNYIDEHNIIIFGDFGYYEGWN